MINLHKRTYNYLLIMFIFLLSSCFSENIDTHITTQQNEVMFGTTPSISTKDEASTSNIGDTLEPSITPTKTEVPTITPIIHQATLPPGEYVLYESGSPGGLYAIPGEGGDQSKIFNNRPVILSSNGRYAVRFSTRYAIEIVDMLEFKSRSGVIPRNCPGIIAISPFGDWFASSCDQNMTLVSIFSDKTVNLTDWDPISPDADYFLPDWSPDGERVSYWGSAGLFYPHENSGLYIATLDCVPHFENCSIQTDGPFFPKEWLGFTAWSSDGQKLAVAKDSFDNLIYIIDIKTMTIIQQIQVSQNVIRGLAWSPDGESIAYGAENGLYIISLADLSSMRILGVSGSNDVDVRGWHHYELFNIVDVED